MGKITIEKVETVQFGNCIYLSNDMIEVWVSIDYGPRIVKFSTAGGENLLLEDTERNLKEETVAIKQYYGEHAVWYSYGGHRLWLSPEAMPETYYPDNEPVSYRINNNQVFFVAPVQVENGVQLSLEITILQEQPKLIINHKAKNISSDIKKMALWAITVMAEGGLEIIPKPAKSHALLPYMNLVVWPYTDINDNRVEWDKEYIIVKQEKINSQTGKRQSPFKIGLNNEAGWASYINKGVMFLKQYIHSKDGEYPDFGVSYETYTNADIIEMETLGQLKDVNPGELIQHKELWSIKEIPENFFT